MEGVLSTLWESVMTVVKSFSICKPCNPLHVTGAFPGVVGFRAERWPVADRIDSPGSVCEEQVSKPQREYSWPASEEKGSGDLAHEQCAHHQRNIEGAHEPLVHQVGTDLAPGWWVSADESAQVVNKYHHLLPESAQREHRA